jgi:hypothetical protein
VTRVIMANDVAQLDVGRHRYGGNVPGRVFDMTPADARAVVKAGGALATVAGVVGRSAGYRCGDCGFASYVVNCSRCGGACGRE